MGLVHVVAHVCGCLFVHAGCDIGCPVESLETSEKSPGTDVNDGCIVVEVGGRDEVAEAIDDSVGWRW